MNKRWRVLVENTEENWERYQALIQYPQISQLKKFSKRIDRANQAIRTFAVDSLREKISDLKIHTYYTWEELGYPDGDMKSSSGITFKVNFITKNIVSIKFTCYSFSLGNAHGFSSVYGFNYDVEKEREIKLENLFVEGSDYLKQISEYVISDLMKQNQKSDSLISPEWLKENVASPKAENFDSFGLTKDVLVIYFDDYEVGSYSTGLRSVRIPFNELKGFSDLENF